jgi:hypothetical protein
MPEAEHVDVPLSIPEEEFLAWNRAAFKTRNDLHSWVRMVVNRALASPTPRPGARSVEHPQALHWLDDDPHRPCEYCGLRLDFTATRRKRFCSDVCRVNAWRLRKRVAEKPQRRSRPRQS